MSWPMIDAMQKRELLYTMNGKPVYRDELRPIGLSTRSVPWKELLYLAIGIGGALIVIWNDYLR